MEAADPNSFEDNAKADWIKALDAVAAKAAWARDLPKGKGIGFAIDDRKSVAPRGIALSVVIKPGSVFDRGRKFDPPTIESLTWCADFKFVEP